MQTHHNSLNPNRWCGVLLAVLGLAFTPVRAQAETIDIQCSPSAVYLDSVANGDWMTVHTDVPFSAVDRDSPVTLNGIEATLLKADNRGNLVAKFDLTVLKDQLAPPSATLTLKGTADTGESFVGSDDVRVVASRSPAGGNQSRKNPTPAPSPKARRGQS